MAYTGRPGFMRPELFAKNEPFKLSTPQPGARVPDGWVAGAEYVGPDRRSGERRTETERREHARVGDGRVPRRDGCGRRDSEHADDQYAALYGKKR